MATVTTQVAATRSVHVKPSVGALAKEGGEEFASGNTAPWEFTLDTPQTDTNHALGLCFLMEVEAPPFPWQQISPGKDTSPWVCPPCNASSHPPFHPQILPPGVELTRSFCQVTPF